MLTVRIKNRATIGNLQGPFEASIKNRGTWLAYSYELDRIVKFLGPDRSPDDVFRQDVLNLKAHLAEKYGYSEDKIKRVITIATSYWSWMVDLGLASLNPFYRMRTSIPRDEVQVIVT